MNTLHNSQLRLLTWLDVERLLKKQTRLWSDMPAGIVAIDCFASGMDIYYSVDEALVDQWLAEVFDRFYSKDERRIQLQIGAADYPVSLIYDKDMQATPVQGYPLWRDVVYLPDGKTEDDEGGNQVREPASALYTDITAPQELLTRPELVSFHSFKGGVGRTSALMTYVAACFTESTRGAKKILVVDADLEAPGVSFWLSDTNKPTVSFVRLMEALHYPPAGVDKTLDYFAEELRKTSYSVKGLERELFVLPAALDLSEIQDMPVTPEHLARNPANPWQLSDYLHALGRRLNVDAVFIDLRAGLSELASPLLFDPRVDHFFVTTVAPQSVLGMVEVLGRLYAYNSRLSEDMQAKARPSIVLSLLTRELRESEYYGRALKQLGQAYPTADPLVQQVQWLEANFNNSLMSIGSIDEALRMLPESSPLYAVAQEWAQALYAVQPVLDPDSDKKPERTEKNRQELARKLHKVCTQAAFAEGSELGHLLAIEPLLNLGKHFAKELPSALVIGAKGAGKTFTFRQLVQSLGWQEFLIKLGFKTDKVIDAAIFPVLWSDNVGDKPDGEIKNAQRKALQQIGLEDEALFLLSQVKRKITDALREPPTHWDDFWDELIASQFGLESSGLAEINDLIRSKGQRIVLVFDGIEDAFQNVSETPAREALESLFKLPNRVSELTNSHLGVLVFARVDYVQEVIRQNVAQLLSRFEPFRLHWNAESFLRLTYMLSYQAGLYCQSRNSETMGLDELKIELEQLWGKKLGRAKSKEAHSARWVYTALCDLKGNVQARDLVRFLKFAAQIEAERPSQTWADRLLAPESMRKAISHCSSEKVEEAKVEISALRNWIEAMETQNLRNIKVPFSAEQAGLDSKTQKALQDLGVIYEDVDSKHGDERLFVPEIYRHGLGFDTSVAGRPRTQALLKKNIGTIPL